MAVRARGVSADPPNSRPLLSAARAHRAAGAARRPVACGAEAVAVWGRRPRAPPRRLHIRHGDADPDGLSRFGWARAGAGSRVPHSVHAAYFSRAVATHALQYTA
eukprot:1451939-Prymnesium_polylepis.1